MENIGLSEEELQLLYTWVDDIPLSRPKRNIARDFSDGVLMAEIVKHFFPKIVQLHNYSAASSQRQKLYNWNTLQQKVFKKIGFQMDQKHVDDIVNCVPGAVEKLLKNFQVKVTQIQQRKTQQRENDQGSHYSEFDDLSPSHSYEEVVHHFPIEKKKKQPTKASKPAAVTPSNAPRSTSKLHQQQQQPQETTPHQQHQYIAYNEDYEEIIADKDLKITELNETVKVCCQFNESLLFCSHRN